MRNILRLLRYGLPYTLEWLPGVILSALVPTNVLNSLVPFVAPILYAFSALPALFVPPPKVAEPEGRKPPVLEPVAESEPVGIRSSLDSK